MSERNNLRKTFSVLQSKIDYNKLNNKIDLYYMEHRNSPYIFMNNETADSLISDVGLHPDGLMGVNEGGLCGSFRGSKVFCDNTLRFGEVELR